MEMSAYKQQLCLLSSHPVSLKHWQVGKQCQAVPYRTMCVDV